MSWLTPEVIAVACTLLGLAGGLIASIWKRSRAEAKLEARLDLLEKDGQTREGCALHREQIHAKLSDIERETAAKLAVGDKKIAVIMERLDSIANGLNEIRSMLLVLYDREGLTPRPQPLPRQPSRPPFKVKKDDD